MKPMMIAGIVLIVLGAVTVFTGGLSFGSQRNVMSVGDMHVSTEQQRMIPGWVGGLAIVGGVVLVGVGVQKRRST